MSFIKSLFLGSEGNYQFCGFDVSFKKRHPSSRLPLLGRVYRILHQRYLYTFVHEFAHNLAFKIFANCSSKTCIYMDGNGLTFPDRTRFSARSVSPKIMSIILAVGPLAITAFAGSSLALSLALRHSLPLVSHWCIGSASYAILDEQLYSIYSVYKRDNGDFGHLTRQPFSHLAAASVAQIGIFILSMYAAYRAY